MNEYLTNLKTARNANLAEQHDLAERLKSLQTEEIQLRGAITALTQIEAAEAEKAKTPTQ